MSEAGVCIVSGHDLHVGEEVTIVFTPEPAGHPMELLGAVRFRSDGGSGVEFLNISRADPAAPTGGRSSRG